MTDDAARRERNLTTVLRAFDAIARGDADAMLARYRDDFVLELPYGSPDAPTVIEGKVAALDHLTAAFGVFRFSLELTEQHETTDPNRLVLEYVSDGTVLTTGKPYRNRYIGVYWFDDEGRVARVREFYNPVPSAIAASPD